MISSKILRLCCHEFVQQQKFVIRTASNAAYNFDSNPGLSSDVKPVNKIPGPKGLYSIPFIGTMLLFKPFTNYTLNDIISMLKDMNHKYGDIVRIRMGKEFFIYVYHPDYAKTIFQLPYKEYHRMPLDIMDAYFKRTGLTRPLSLLEGEEWAALRKPTQEKMLRPANVASYVPLISRVTNDFVEVLRKKGKIDDLQKELMNYTTESVGMLCFNKRLRCFDSERTTEIVDHMQQLFAALQISLTMPIKTFKYFRTPLYKQFEKGRNGLSNITQRELAAQRSVLAKIEKDGNLEEYLDKEPNFMYSLLTDPRMTDEKVDSIVTSLFGAGIDSTANSMVFILTDLALNPKKQEVLYKEIQHVIGNSTLLTKEQIGQMSYLKACVKESQRKTFPIAIGPPRTTETDVILGGYRIPKNTLVIANMTSMGLDERFFPSPNEYIPERWLRGTNDPITKGQEFPFGTKPFGFGPRGCIGQRFAELELYIGVSKIIQNFELSMPPGVTEVKSICRAFTAPLETVVLQLKDRKESNML